MPTEAQRTAWFRCARPSWRTCSRAGEGCTLDSRSRANDLASGVRMSSAKRLQRTHRSLADRRGHGASARSVGAGIKLACVNVALGVRGEGQKVEEEKMKRVTVLLAAGLIVLAAVALPMIRAGAQGTVVNDNNLDQMIANAKTSADHEAIAAYFEQEAADAEKKADLHKSTAETYRKLKLPKPVYMAEMCDGIASGFEKTAKDAEDLAKMHHEMAKEAGVKTGQ